MRIYTKVAAVKRMKFAISFHNQFKKSSPLEWNYNPSPPPPLTEYLPRKSNAES